MDNRKIYLRLATESDSKVIHSWWTDGRIMASVGFPNGLPITLDDVRRDINNYLTSSTSEFLIVLDEEMREIGEFTFSKKSSSTNTFGMKIGCYESQGKGYGRLALSEGLKRIGAQSDVRRTEISVDTENTRALLLYKSFGFCTVQTLKDNWTDQLGRLRSTEILELNV